MVLSVVGGTFILLWGLLLAAVGARALSLSLLGGGLVVIGSVEAVLGLLVLLFGILLYVSPESHVIYGILVLVFSIVSLIGLGGLFIGFLLGLIGGILGIVHRPRPSVVFVPPQRVCPKCGTVPGPNARFCAACGHPFG
jgi:hypothetical protein